LAPGLTTCQGRQLARPQAADMHVHMHGSGVWGEAGLMVPCTCVTRGVNQCWAISVFVLSLLRTCVPVAATRCCHTRPAWRSSMSSSCRAYTHCCHSHTWRLGTQLYDTDRRLCSTLYTLHMCHLHSCLQLPVVVLCLPATAAGNHISPTLTWHLLHPRPTRLAGSAAWQPPAPRPPGS
jgi:hypothetical protein